MRLNVASLLFPLGLYKYRLYMASVGIVFAVCGIMYVKRNISGTHHARIVHISNRLHYLWFCSAGFHFILAYRLDGGGGATALSFVCSRFDNNFQVQYNEHRKSYVNEFVNAIKSAVLITIKLEQHNQRKRPYFHLIATAS